MEWIDSDGNKDISDSCRDNSTIVDLYALKQIEQSNAMKRKPGETPRDASKRRRKAKQAASKEASTAEEPEAVPDAIETTTGSEILPAGDSPHQDADEHQVPTESKIDTSSTQPSLQGPATIAESRENEETVDPCLHFYLLKPGTTSKEKVLIPLNRQATLTSCLRDRTVLEFPTIYVLPHEPTSLPPEYMLESTYLQLQKSEKQELKEAVASAEEKGAFQHVRSTQAQASSARPNVPLDANSILNVLKRDMTRQ